MIIVLAAVAACACKHPRSDRARAERHAPAPTCEGSARLRFYVASESATGGPSVDTGSETWYLEKSPFLCEKHISRVEVDRLDGLPDAKIFVTPLGRQIFRTVTSANLGGHIALFLEKVVLAVPRLETVVDSDAN